MVYAIQERRESKIMEEALEKTEIKEVIPHWVLIPCTPAAGQTILSPDTHNTVVFLDFFCCDFDFPPLVSSSWC